MVFVMVLEMREGSIIDRYRVRGKLGQGGMGSVYKVQDMDTGEILAMKVVNPAVQEDSSARERFFKEAKALAPLMHPHVIRFHGIWPMPDGSFALLMDFIVGRDLRTLQREPMAPKKLVELLNQVAMGLDYCHSKDVVHRDVKPDNVMVSEAGSSTAALLVDFGLGKNRGQSSGATAYGFAAGTPPYMPPEQMHDFRNSGPKADQWALAVSAWWLLTDEYPFVNSPYEYDGRCEIGEPAPHLPSQLESVFARAFQIEPDARYLSCVDFTRQMGAAFGMDLPLHAKDRIRRKITERIVPVVPEVDWSIREQDDLWGFCAGRLGNTVRTVAATRGEKKESIGSARLTVRVLGELLVVELPVRPPVLPVDLASDPRVRSLEELGWRRPGGPARPWSLRVAVDHDPDDVAKRVLEALELGYGLEANDVYKHM